MQFNFGTRASLTIVRKPRPLRLLTLSRQATLTALFLCASLLSCTTLIRGRGIDRVWPATHMYLPDRAPVRVEHADLAAVEREVKAPLPTVIFLHGSTGYQRHYFQAAYPAALAQAGFAVFVPDSYARPGRVSAEWDVRIDTVNLRRAEVDDTLDHLRNIPWVDQRNIFLAGHSEGGITTAMYGGGDFRAYFISGWTCRSENPEFNRIHAPADKPVLAILGAEDKYHRTKNAGHCGQVFEPLRNAKSRSIVLPGIGHEVNTHPDTIPTLISFFKAELIN